MREEQFHVKNPLVNVGQHFQSSLSVPIKTRGNTKIENTRIACEGENGKQVVYDMMHPYDYQKEPYLKNCNPVEEEDPAKVQPQDD